MEEDKIDDAPQNFDDGGIQADENPAMDNADPTIDAGGDETASPSRKFVADDENADPDAGPALIEGAEGIGFGGDEEEKKTENVAPEVLEDINKLFEIFDEDEDGLVDINELFVIMKALDVKPLEEEEQDLIK